MLRRRLSNGQLRSSRLRRRNLRRSSLRDCCLLMSRLGKLFVHDLGHCRNGEISHKSRVAALRRCRRQLFLHAMAP